MLVPRLDWGPRALRTWVNESLIPWIQRGRPLRSHSCEIDEREDGTLILPSVVKGGAAGPRLVPFQLLVVVEEDESYSIRVVVSTLGNEIPTGMYPLDDPIFTLPDITGDGVVFCKVTFVATTGAITAREILEAATLPADTSTTAHFPLGYYATDEDGALAVNNTAFGPVSAVTCRDWFVESSTPSYDIHFGAAAVNLLS